MSHRTGFTPPTSGALTPLQITSTDDSSMGSPPREVTPGMPASIAIGTDVDESMSDFDSVGTSAPSQAVAKCSPVRRTRRQPHSAGPLSRVASPRWDLVAKGAASSSSGGLPVPGLIQVNQHYIDHPDQHTTYMQQNYDHSRHTQVLVQVSTPPPHFSCNNKQQMLKQQLSHTRAAGSTPDRLP
jgi:hypothetical protein